MADRILVVEDDRDFSLQLTSLWEFSGFEVGSAHTGTEGLERFAEDPPDLVLLDVMLPESHGLSVLERIRELPGGTDVPTVLMSAVYDRGDVGPRDQARLGVVAFLTRPFSLNNLGRRVREILGRPEKGRASVRTAMKSADRSPDQAGMALVSGPMAQVPDVVSREFADVDEDELAFGSAALQFELGADAIDIDAPDDEDDDPAGASGFFLVAEPGPLHAPESEAEAATAEPAQTAAPTEEAETAEPSEEASQSEQPPPPYWLPSLAGDDSIEFEIEITAPSAPPPPPPPKPRPTDEIRGGVESTDLFRTLLDGRPNQPRLWTRAMVGLHLNRRAGRLSLIEDERTRSLLFLNGYPVWVAVEPFCVGLPAWLVAQGQLPPRKGVKFVELHQKKGWSIPRTLLALKRFEPDEVDELLQTWVADEVRAGFDRKGILRWSPGDSFAGSVPVFESNPVRCLWPCVRGIRLGRLELELSHRESHRLVRTPAALRILDRLPESEAALSLQAALATPSTWRELLAGSREQREATLRLLWMLEQGGGLTESDEAVEVHTPVPRSDFETGRIPRSMVGSLRSELDDQEAVITRDWLEMMQQPAREFLGLPEGSGPADVRRVYRELSERWRISGGEAFSRPDTGRKAKELSSRLRQCFQEILAASQRSED